MLSLDFDEGINQGRPQVQEKFLKHPDKAHFILKINSEAFIDLIELHAIEQGGATLNDSYGLKFLLYPIFRKENQEGRETAVLSFKSDFMNTVAWAEGTSPEEFANVYWIPKNSNLENAYTLESTGVLNYILTDEIDPKFLKEMKQKFKIEQKSNLNKVFIVDLKNMSTIDNALNKICSVLAKQVSTLKEIMDGFYEFGLMSSFLLCLLLETFLSFWLVMESNDWDFNRGIQVLIYIGFLLASFIFNFVVLFILDAIGIVPFDQKSLAVILYTILWLITHLTLGILKFLNVIKSGIQPDIKLYSIHFGVYVGLAIVLCVGGVLIKYWYDQRGVRSYKEYLYGRHRLHAQ
ncbi:hypothetical protein FGO68_gene11744 [Halteria grandinella]|uniref:Uncharacterized protein n=1 Tax=Halteria grandinella TaxID=5974 RepID=A0A8J8NKG5_HALGN|nr:hypothetical protein FGO68_gene11744 [Halteria grandinella]